MPKETKEEKQARKAAKQAKKQAEKVDPAAAALKIADLEAENAVLAAENLEFAKIALPIAELGAGGIKDCSSGNEVHLMTIIGCDEPGKKEWVEHKPPLPVPYFTKAAKLLARLKIIVGQ